MNYLTIYREKKNFNDFDKEKNKWKEADINIVLCISSINIQVQFTSYEETVNWALCRATKTVQ